MFDPGGSKSRLRAFRFLGAWRALFVGSLSFWSGCWRPAAFLAGRMSWASTCRREICELFTPYLLRPIAVSSAARLAFNMPCQAMGAGRAARGDWKSGANGCQRASWSEELDGKEFCGALASMRNLEPRGTPFSRHRLRGQPIFFTDYKVVYRF